MNLTEGQLFTIEVLNRIEGFSWPDGMSCAGMMEGGCSVWFFQGAVATMPDFLSFTGRVTSSRAGVEHPDWRNSLITREQFDSVDGWVRNDGSEPVISGDFDLLLADGEVIYFSDMSVDRWDWSVPCKDGVAITHWRYHKPIKETEMQQPKPYKKRDCIETLIDKRKDAIEQKRIALAALEEAEAKERELMLSIQAWSESYGFDIRVLDESDEAPEVEPELEPNPKPEPELVITDWRDLRVGDEIWWSGGAGFSSGRYIISEVSKKGVSVTTWKGQSWLDVLNTAWKFIRRPCK